jgi:chromosome segregation ATPase
MEENKIIKILTKHGTMLTKHDKDIGLVKGDVKELKTDMKQVKGDIRQIDTQIDFLVKKVLEHDERLDRIETNMATKKDIQNISGTLDKLVGLAEKKDQELTIVTHDMRHLEGRVKVLEKDKIK